MPLLKDEAEKLSQSDMRRGVIEEIIEKDDLFRLLPWDSTTGKAYVYNREATLATGSWLDPNETVQESASTFEQITTNLRILVGDVDVDKFLEGTMNDLNGQRAAQIAAKLKGMSNQFKNAVINGDVANKEFDGIQRLVTSAQTITAGANGAALTFDMLDELLDAVSNGADVIFMREGTVRAYRALLRAAGGNDAAMLQLEGFGRPVLTHNGVPIIVNNYIAGDDAQGTNNNTASIYAARLNEADGLHGIFGGAGAGFVVEDLGTVQNKDATRTRIKWYAGMALKSTLSLARIQGVTNV